ncbi:MAG: hypothetical protein J7M13_06485 [Synergistetes bacterium]|nr:hypothetical protein [Synergistota bacterium]
MLEGAIDMHVHTSPDIVPRKLSDLELVRAAEKAGMAGVLLKNHFEPTVSRAIIVQKLVRKTKVYGGIVLNNSVGGLNPEAVEVALKLGAKEVWMPTVDAVNHLEKEGKPSYEGITILREDGRLKDEVYDILDMISKGAAILGTGHLSLREILILIEEALRRGVQKILVTHPEFWITRVPLDIQKELSKRGVYFERCFYVATISGKNGVPVRDIACAIKFVGVQSTIISSDLGQVYNPDPISGLGSYVRELMKAGIMESEIDIMLKMNPRELLL